MAETTPIARLNELIQGFDIAILTTVRPNRSLHSRPMASQAADDQGILWFLAHNNSEKVEDLRTNQHVNVAYADHSAERYVSVSGFCELVRDQAMTKKLWQPPYATWYPGGPEDPALVLLKVVVQQAEYWDAAHGRMVLLAGFPGIV